MKSKVVYWGLQVAQQTKTLKLWPNDCKFESQVILLLHQQPESESTIPIALSLWVDFIISSHYSYGGVGQHWHLLAVVLELGIWCFPQSVLGA